MGGFIGSYLQVGDTFPTVIIQRFSFPSHVGSKTTMRPTGWAVVAGTPFCDNLINKMVVLPVKRVRSQMLRYASYILRRIHAKV
jgi:hypothetical protein